MKPLSPDTRITPTRKFTPYIPLLGFIAISLVFAITSFQAFLQVEEMIVKDKIQDLDTVADLKMRQISDWKRMQIRRGESFAKGSFLPDQFGQWLQQGMPREGKEKILRFLASMQNMNGYKDITLFDKDGMARLTTLESEQLDPDNVVMARAAIGNRQVSMSDIHMGGARSSEIRIDLAAPLISLEGNEERVMGAVVFQIDPHEFLYPLMQAWPYPSPSAETLLVRRDGDHVLLLTELRHRQGAALSLRQPLTDTSLPGVMAVLGKTSSIDGIDYRGVQVVSAMRKIPGTPWFIVSKVDKGEFLAQVIRLKQWSMALGGTLAFIGGMLVFFWLRAYQVRYRYLKDQHEAALEREMLVRHFELLTKHANDMILVADDATRIIEANERALETFGYTRDELLNMQVADLRDLAQDISSVNDRLSELMAKGELRVEENVRRKDGSIFPVEISARVIEVQGKRYLQGILRDITERKQAERKINRLNNLYSAISRSNETIVRIKDRDKLFDEICRIAVEFGQFKLAWIGMVDDATHRVEVAASSGEARGYLDGIHVSIDAEKPEGRGPTGMAIRDNREYVRDDFLNDPSTLPWRENARKHGIRSSASCPLEFEGRTVGALTVYAEEANYFDQDLTNLLSDLARDISLALDNFAREDRRRQAEETLRLSEEKFRTLVGNLPQKVFVKDANSVYSACNALFATDLGIKPEEIVGKSDYDFFPKELAEKYIADDSRIINSGEVKSFEEMHLHHGQERFVHTTKAPLKDEQGKIIGVIGVFWDITDIKRAEDEQRKSAEMIEDLYNNAPCGYHSLDADGVIIHMNHTELKWLGYTADEIIGKKKIIDLYSPQSREVFEKSFSRFKEQGFIHDLEVEMVCKDGRLMTVLLNASGIYDAEGKFLMSRSTMFDISDRKLAEKKLFESEQRFRAMADNAPIIIWMANAGRGKAYMGCGFFNKRWHEFTGLALDESQGYNWMSIVHPGDKERCLDDYIRAFEEAREFKLEYRLRRKDGAYRWMRDAGVPRFTAEGEFLGFIGTCIDITDQKLIEEMRAEVEHVGRLNIAGEMASGLAHELSQPLTAASNYLDGCLHRMEQTEWDREKLRKAVKLAYLQTERAGSIISHLKALIRKQGPERAMMDINDLIEDSVDFLEHDLSHQSIQVIPHFSVLPHVWVNKIEIEQVLINLMKNAIDSMATLPRRELHLSTRLVDSGNILVTVSDTGKGIPEADLDRVFNPFQTSKQDGLGLGLAICRSLVENHGGRIWAEQNGDAGMEFSFTLPTESMNE